MKFEIDEKPIEQLLLDPNNYRFMDLPQWRPRQSNRFHNPSVQESTLRLFESVARYNLNELRQSILANGYVRLERIVIVPYQYTSNRYLVIEGNRRVAALKTLLRDNNDGVLSLTPEQIADFTTVPVAILDPEEDALISATRIIMGIRHIAGPQEWGAYQQALLIVQLIDDEGQDFTDVSKHLNLSDKETHRRYRAMRALKAMENDESYSSAAKPEYYRLFNELISIPNVREFFSWDNDTATFTDQEKSRQFYEMIESLDAEATPKLRTYLDVRRLRGIIGNPRAESTLLDPEQPLSAALALLQVDYGTQAAADIMTEARRFRRIMDDTQIDALTGLTLDDISSLDELSNILQSRIEQYRRLV